MKTKICLLIAALAFVFACQANTASAQAVKKGMIKVTIVYPNGEGKTFDMNYYTTKHFPMLRRLFGDAMKATAIDKGIAGGAPGAAAPYAAIGYLYFDNIAAFQGGMKNHAAEIRADIPNYTNITPVIQISEVVE
ncbi:EthD family reductase [Mucilaginibacter sp. 14171R-50]|uniref:EthD family reductase n=1 Tax=Mucilaginibacter sp. 14171R-50 TaxID=2703789 RepID=UPI00192EE330|nr:EthD family reductase [Mucilaginibacter sp. 14171R-50]